MPFEPLPGRYGRRSISVTANAPIAAWNEMLPNLAQQCLKSTSSRVMRRGTKSKWAATGAAQLSANE